MAELLGAMLLRLRTAKGFSRSDLSRKTVRVGYEGVPEITIKSLETIPGRIPDADTLEALARALGEEPSVFYEWPILEARRATKKARSPKAELEAELEEAAQHTRRQAGSTGAAKGGRRGRKAAQ